MKKPYLFLLIILCLSCSSTNVSVKDNFTAKGKRLGIGLVKLSAEKKANKSMDTVCICKGQSTAQALIPYLQRAGFSIINLPVINTADNIEAMRIADSLKVDYILTGLGIVNIVGKRKDTFIDQLTIQVQDINSSEIILSASFSGMAIRPVKAAAKIGEQIIKKVKPNF